jgi:hypothetical protein
MSLKESEKLEWASGVASLAGHYMNEARKATSKEKIAEHETHATRLINKMTSALPAVPLTFLASGLSLVVKKDWEKAKQALTSVLQQVPDCKIARYVHGCSFLLHCVLAYESFVPSALAWQSVITTSRIQRTLCKHLAVL